jgi:RND family efflux transporter MFP subunit
MSVVTGVAWLIGCGGGAPETKPKPKTAVVAKPATRRAVDATLALTGTVEPERTARLSAQVDGEVELLSAREGDPVHSGDILVRIDPSRLRAALDEARGEELAIQSDLAAARGVLERDRVLFERRGIGEERLEQSEATLGRLEANLLVARARVAGLAAQLADTEVRAPFDGYILTRAVELGDVVRSGSPLVAVASDETMVLVQVSEIDLGRLRLGDEARVATGEAKQQIAANITRIRPQVDPMTRTAAVEVTPTGATPRLLPGMMARVTFSLERAEDVIAVPADAVLRRPDGSHALYVVADGAATQRVVDVGLEGGGWREISDGLDEGEMVVLQGQERLRDGAAVVVKGVAAAAASPAPGNQPPAVASPTPAAGADIRSDG